MYYTFNYYDNRTISIIYVTNSTIKKDYLIDLILLCEITSLFLDYVDYTRNKEASIVFFRVIKEIS